MGKVRLKGQRSKVNVMTRPPCQKGGGVRDAPIEFCLVKTKIVIAFVIRPPDIHVGGHILLIFYHEFFFFRPLISELAERNSTKIGHMFGSK